MKCGNHGAATQPVRCLTTGEVFPSVKAAAAWCGATPQNLSTSISSLHGRKSAAGHKWAYVVKPPSARRKKGVAGGLRDAVQVTV